MTMYILYTIQKNNTDPWWHAGIPVYWREGAYHAFGQNVVDARKRDSLQSRKEAHNLRSVRCHLAQIQSTHNVASWALGVAADQFQPVLGRRCANRWRACCAK